MSTAALTLTAPQDGQKVRPGGAIPAAVHVEDSAQIQSVQYFWFRVGDESIGPHQAEPAAFQPANPSQPLVGMVLVPAEAIGQMRLLAVAEILRGRLAGHQDFDEVVVTVQPEARLTAIEFAVEKPWRLDTIGKRVSLPVLGQYEDGIARVLQGHATGSRFSSSNESVVRVDQQGEVLIAGNGKAVIIVANQQQEGRLEVIVEGDAAPNGSPLAVVPPSLTVKPGAVVRLDGLESRDPDGDPLMFRWKQVRGNKVDLTTPNEARTSFIAPVVSQRRLLQFQLVVTDLTGPDTVKGADSEPAVMDVWIEPSRNP